MIILPQVRQLSSITIRILENELEEKEEEQGIKKRKRKRKVTTIEDKSRGDVERREGKERRKTVG